MSDDYTHGQRDGLRIALAVLAAEEEKWAALLGESPAWRTNVVREARHKTLQIMQKRLHTVLNKLAPKQGEAIDAEFVSALDKIGL